MSTPSKYERPTLFKIYHDQNSFNLIRGNNSYMYDFVLKASAYEYSHAEIVKGLVEYYYQMKDSAERIITRVVQTISANIDILTAYAEYRARIPRIEPIIEPGFTSCTKELWFCTYYEEAEIPRYLTKDGWAISHPRYTTKEELQELFQKYKHSPLPVTEEEQERLKEAKWEQQFIRNYFEPEYS